MSPLSTDLSVLLLPGRALARRAGQATEVRQGTGWEGALASLEVVLKQAGRGSGARVVLSHHFAGLHLLAPPPVRLAGEEMRAWLHEQLARAFGAEAETWRLAWEDVPPGRSIPVASLPQGQHEALAERLAATGLNLRALAPWLVTAWSRHWRAFSRADGWLALAEPGRLALARLERGRLQGIDLSRLDQAEPLAAQVAACIARQALREGVPAEGEVHVLAPEGTADGNLPATALRFKPLPGCGAGWEGLLP